VVSANSLSGNDEIAVTGADFMTSGYTAEAWFAQIKADSVSVTDATSITITFTDGVPFNDGSSPLILFTETATGL